MAPHTAALAEGAGADRVQADRTGIYRRSQSCLADEFHQSSDVETRQHIRSASLSSLVVRHTRLSAVGDRGFPRVVVEHPAQYVTSALSFRCLLSGIASRPASSVVPSSIGTESPKCDPVKRDRY